MLVADSRGERVQLRLFQIEPQLDRHRLDQVTVPLALPPQHMADAVGGDRDGVFFRESLKAISFTSNRVSWYKDL